MASGGGSETGSVFDAARPLGRPPEFHRRVLDDLPAPVLVVDQLGDIVYVNEAMQALGGWSDHELDSNIIQHLHPDDARWVAEAFIALASSGARAEQDRTRWAAVQLRVIATDGSEVPIEVSGTGGLDDPDIDGIIYSVQPAHSQWLLSRVLTGIAAGDSVEELLSAVLDMVATPPLDLDAAILRPTTTGDHEVMAATSRSMRRALTTVTDPVPWSEPTTDVAFVPVADLPGDLASALAADGYVDCWHVAVESRMTSSTFRIVACSPTHHVPATGVISRLLRAQELAAVVLLRSESDVLLAHAAFHDHLTQLTNRAGLMNHMEDVGAREDRALSVLYIDLDGFKPINDEHGHDAGDRVLQVTADRLREESRSNDLVARVGGDEFVLVLGAETDRSTAHQRAQATAERLVTSINRPIDIDGVSVQVSASIGVVVSESDDTVMQLLSQADRAMFTAKRAGGHRGHLHAG